jgi:hypothetical protein
MVNIKRKEIVVLAAIPVLLGIVMVAPFIKINLVFAQQNKTQECQSRHADMISRIQQWLAKRQSFTGQQDLNGSKAEAISISNDMIQVGLDCKDVIDISQPPPGYTMEDYKRLPEAVNKELCKMGVKCVPQG